MRYTVTVCQALFRSKTSGNQDFSLKNQEVIRNFLALKVSYKIISKWIPSTPLSKSFLQDHIIFPICKLFQFMFWWLESCINRNGPKEWNQQTDLKTEYPYYSCLHKVTFKNSPFECSYSNLVHQQNI